MDVTLDGMETLVNRESGAHRYSFSVGDRLGSYEVLRPLGAGGMGEVYLVEHRLMHKRYALKVLPSALFGNDQFVDRFRIEARVMADLNHPNIVQVHHMDELNGVYYLTMDYVVGPDGEPQTLDDLIKKTDGKLDELIVKEFVLQICSALRYAHGFRGKGVVHRDLKPSNILLSKNREEEGGKSLAHAFSIKIADFGLAKVVGEDYLKSVIEQSVSLSLRPSNCSLGDKKTLVEGEVDEEGTSARSILGTYEYMSPEQKRGEKVDARSDIFALGLILYVMLTARKPEGRWKLPSQLGCSLGWDAIVERCLEPDAHERVQSAGELLALTQGVVISKETGRKEEETGDGGGGEAKKERKESKNLKKKVLFGLVALLVVAGSVGFWSLWGSKEEMEPLVAEQVSTPNPTIVEPEKKIEPEQKVEKKEGPKKKELTIDLSEAKDALRSGNTDAAKEKVQPALKLDSNNSAESEMLLDVEKMADERKARTIKTDAEMAVEKIQKEISDRRQGFGSKFQTLEKQMRIAQDAYASKSWVQAFTAFTGVERECSALLILAGERRESVAFRKEMEGKRRGAEAKNAAALAKKEWDNGVGVALQAGKAFENGDFEEASNGWKNAAERFQTSEKLAAAVSSYRKAKGAWEGRMSNIEQRISNTEVERYAAEEWTAAERSARLGAASTSEPVLGKEHYVAALASFNKAVEKALQRMVPEMKWTAQLGGGVEMEFMPIAAGTFQMGSSMGEDNEKPVRQVTFENSFWMAKTEVTIGQWKRFLEETGHTKGTDWSDSECPLKKSGTSYTLTKNKFGMNFEQPMVEIDWNASVEFCKWLTTRERKAGRLPAGDEYVLPTETQWEYACRAGTTGKYAGDLDALAWYGLNSGNKTHPVGTKKANGWGLHDMHGNVREWCLDDWHESYDGAPANGSRWGDGSGFYRVNRGGSCYNSAENCRSAYRPGLSPSYTFHNLGFRACLVRKYAPLPKREK